MDRFAQSQGTLSDVWKQAAKQTLPLIRVSWLILLLVWLGAMIVIYADHLVLIPLAANLAVSVVGYLLALFFTGSLLLCTQAIQDNEPLTFMAAMERMLARSPSYFTTILIFLAVIVSYYLGGGWLIHHFTAHPAAASGEPETAVMYFMMGVVAPLIVMIVFFIFAIPLTVIESCGPFKAFLRSYRLVGKHWLRAFSIYGVVCVLFILTVPTTLHAHFLMRYYVYPLFVLIVYMILMPFITSLIVSMRTHLDVG